MYLLFFLVPLTELELVQYRYREIFSLISLFAFGVLLFSVYSC
nr:MAG TPA_asm: hypothetical protein [Inoviridae sp.]